MRYTLDSSEIDADILSQFVSGPNPQFHAVYTIEVGHELTMSLTVCNDGDEPLSYEEALHTYLQVGDAEQSQVCGLEGADYLDTVLDGDPRCSQGDEPVTFQGMVDRIYYSTDTLELRDPVLQRTIIVAKQGAAQTVVWNPGEQAGNAIGDLERRRMAWLRLRGSGQQSRLRSRRASARLTYLAANTVGKALKVNRNCRIR